jgi:hypothetical protein
MQRQHTGKLRQYWASCCISLGNTNLTFVGICSFETLGLKIAANIRRLGKDRARTRGGSGMWVSYWQECVGGVAPPQESCKKKKKRGMETTSLTFRGTDRVFRAPLSGARVRRKPNHGESCCDKIRTLSRSNTCHRTRSAQSADDVSVVKSTYGMLPTKSTRVGKPSCISHPLVTDLQLFIQN